MNSNTNAQNTNIDQLISLISKIKTQNELNYFFKELLTESEINTLSKRWQIIQRLLNGDTQRQISKDLKVSLCKVTRGSKIIQNKNSVLTKYLKKEIKNDCR